MPADGLSYVQDLGLQLCECRKLLDLIVDDAVATRHVRVCEVNGIAIDAVCLQHIVGLAVRQGLLLSLAERDLLDMLGLRHDIELQAVDTIHARNGARITVFYYSCLARLAADGVVLMLYRSVLPIEGQFALANSDRVFSQEARIDIQIEFPDIVASAFGLFLQGVGACGGEVDGGIVVRTPCIGKLGITDAYRVALVEWLADMHEYLDDAVATVYGPQVLDDGLTLVVVLAVVADAGFRRTAVHVANDGVAVRRQYGQPEYIDRIHLRASLCPYGIHISAADLVVLIAPAIYLAIAYRELGGNEVGVRRSCYHSYTQFVDAVAAKLRSVGIAVETVGIDLLSVPDERLALNDRGRVVLEETAGLVQVDTKDRVATRGSCQGVVYYGRMGISATLPYYLAAERDGIDRTFCRQNGQYQFVDAVVARTRLVAIIIVDVVAHLAAQVFQAAPAEVLALADGQVLYEMVGILIFGQHEAP